ncbi:hypothetical protein D8676_22440 [Mesorhizobium sp. YM1C-6-2]|nr:hypothetical protein D8676_22440 [Mesorhizobium sp. YM1C-6-2]
MAGVLTDGAFSGKVEQFPPFAGRIARSAICSIRLLTASDAHLVSFNLTALDSGFRCAAPE